MPKPKHDYDSEEFYNLIQESADRQMRENHIIWDGVVAKDLDLGVSVFSHMKQGDYAPWSKEENERRSKTIKQILKRAREGAEPEVWKMILDLGLGKAQAQDITFDKIGGEVQDHQRITVHKLAPNLNALQMWLRHHSEIYRSIERGEEENGSELYSENGIDIDKWMEENTNK